MRSSTALSGEKELKSTCSRTARAGDECGYLPRSGIERQGDITGGLKSDVPASFGASSVIEQDSRSPLPMQRFAVHNCLRQVGSQPNSDFAGLSTITSSDTVKVFVSALS